MNMVKQKNTKLTTKLWYGGSQTNKKFTLVFWSNMQDLKQNVSCAVDKLEIWRLIT